jgi:tetratricopeptide (TPR) repeat protein
MPWKRIIIFTTLAIALAGCGKKKEVTSLQRKAAANYISEAQFAVSVRDYARAESLYAKAAAACPDTGEYWLGLGSMRIRLGQRDQARDAYKSALKAYQEDAAAKPTEVQPVLQQVTVLLLLGRTNDARAIVATLPKKFPGHRAIQGIDDKSIDELVKDPKFKELAI